MDADPLLGHNVASALWLIEWSTKARQKWRAFLMQRCVQLAHGDSTAATAGVRRRFAPHQRRHAHAVEMAHEGVPLIVIQRQLGHSNLGITSIYLQGIDNAEIIEAVHARRAPMLPVSASLRL
jgi:site-specific recombinase XerD